MLQYNAEYSGQIYQMIDGFVYVQREDGLFAATAAVENQMVSVQLTGYYTVSARGNTMYQLVSGRWINLTEGWQYKSRSTLKGGSARDAQRFVDGVIKNNARILENNLLCARFADQLTEDEKAEVRELQNRMALRNQQLLTDGMVSEQALGSPPGYSDLVMYLEKLMNNVSGVGVVISATGVVVISAVVVAAVSLAAYYAYKAMYNESKEDVKFSDELTKKLTSVLTEEEYQQLLDETQGMVTKAKISGRFSNTAGIVKWGLIGFGVFAIYKAFTQKGGTRNDGRM